MDLSKLVLDTVRDGDHVGFRTLMAMGADVNRTYEGFSPLHVACFTGRSAFVEEIIKHGGDVEFEVAECRDRESTDWDTFTEWTPLCIAAWLGLEEIVTILINHNVNVESVDRVGKTALILACEKGHLTVIKSLIKHGAAFVRCGSYVPLFTAASKGHVGVIEEILQAGVPLNLTDSKQWNMLHYAAMNGQAGTVQYLMSKQCPVLKSSNGVTPAFLAAMYGHLAVLQVFSEVHRSGNLVRASNSDSESPLHMACKNGHLEVVQFLLQIGCDMNQGNWTGHTPLCYAVRHGHYDIVELLVNSGCDTNIPKIPYLPPIFQARHNLDMVKTLVKGGADVNVVDTADGSLLMYAAGQREARGLDLLAFLLESGAWVDQQCFWGETALFKAIVSSNLKAMKLLIQFGSNINIRNARALTPLQVAVGRGYTEGVQLLVKSGVNVHQKAAFSKVTILEYALCRAAEPNLCRLLRSSGAVIRPSFYSRYFQCFDREIKDAESMAGTAQSSHPHDRPLSDFIRGHLHSSTGKRTLNKIVTTYQHLISSEFLGPISLQDRLRNCIRQLVQYDDSNIRCLPIPPLLKHFLLYEDTSIQFKFATQM
ncbi:ankyrin repeat and KH domain-containing protein 1-like [Liolophura sinensis]|uniref:ankyrin repeat and KH domain-containing protein 1-like n=1 Tax=Liolophura sinensis TaxID=3198878 RepID=UPI003158B5B9